MNNNLLYKFSYGLFVITTANNKQDNGCIINTAMQVTENPQQISVVINKNNFTYEMLTENHSFNISIISEKADFELFRQFGFQSGRNTDKFSNFNDIARSKNGIYYITKGTNAYLSAAVTNRIDLGTHCMLIADITDSEIINDDNSATYEYYQSNIKPKPEKKKSGYICKVCGYVYNGEELPENYICPICKHGVSAFEKI